MATAYVKGGMPLTAHGSVTHGGSNSYGSDEPEWSDVEVDEVLWFNTGKPISKGFEATLSGADWEAIKTAIMEEGGGW